MESAILPRATTVSLGPGNGRDLLELFGSDLFGLIASWFLLGMLLVQVYYYFLNFKRDPVWIKIFVYTVLILDCIQSGLVTEAAFKIFSTYWGNPLILHQQSKTIIAVPLFAGFVAMMIQIFYAWRIWTLGSALSNRRIVLVICVVIVMLALLQGISAMIGSFLYIKLHSVDPTKVDIFAQVTKLARIISLVYLIWPSASFCCDLILTVVMFYLLTTAKTSSFFRSTNDFLSKLLLLTLASGAATTICALIDLILYKVFLGSALYEPPAVILGKLFANSLLVNLNFRRSADTSLYTVDLSTQGTDDDTGHRNTEIRFASNTEGKSRVGISTGNSAFNDSESMSSRHGVSTLNREDSGEVIQVVHPSILTKSEV